MLLYFTSQETFNIEIGGVDDACEKKKTCIVFGLLTNIHLSITLYSMHQASPVVLGTCQVLYTLTNAKKSDYLAGYEDLLLQAYLMYYMCREKAAGFPTTPQ